MADVTFLQSLKELFSLMMLVVLLGCLSWLVIYANLTQRFWQQRHQIPRYLSRCGILAARLAIGAAIIGFIIGMLILAAVLIIYTLAYLTLELLAPGLIVHPLAIIFPVFLVSVILGSLLETRAMNKKISLYDLRILSSQKVIPYWGPP